MLLAVEAMVLGLPTIQATSAEVTVGVPEVLAARINAFITIGSATPDYSTFDGAVRSPRIQVSFAYRVGGDERASELAIAELIDELTAAVEADPNLGGTSDDPLTLDTAGADRPDYQGKVGAEARVYPMTLIGRQQH